jgi:hypothetical protein
MSINPVEIERSRAAVAVSCLRWLQCTGPAIEPARVAPRDDPPTLSIRPIPEPPAGPTHPLYDPWLDG